MSGFKCDGNKSYNKDRWRGIAELYKNNNGTFPYYVWEEKIVAVAQAVDLGLPSGTKWASWNIGASTPQEYGDDYAWGELHTKTDFVKSTYQYYNSTSEKYDYIGNSICGNSQYDIAKHLWGGNWQLPSKTDFEELVKTAQCNGAI